MKKVLFVFLLSALLVFPPNAQSAGVKKFPGEASIFTWNFLIADESKITGFRMYSAPAASGPFAFTGTFVTPTLRTASLSTAFPAGSVIVFYSVRAVYTSGTSTVESVNSNSVEVDMKVPTPTVLSVR
jgi:hypothetical protein